MYGASHTKKYFDSKFQANLEQFQLHFQWSTCYCNCQLIREFMSLVGEFFPFLCENMPYLNVEVKSFVDLSNYFVYFYFTYIDRDKVGGKLAIYLTLVLLKSQEEQNELIGLICKTVS